MPAIIQLIQNLLGTSYFTLVTAPDGFPIVVYSAEYITGAILLICFFIGLFKIVLQFQKSTSRRG